MSKRLVEHISANWFKYVAVLVFVPIFFGMIFDAMAKPKANEQVVISFFGDKMDVEGINDMLYKEKSSFTNQPLKNVYIDFNSVDGQILYQLIAAKAEYSDIIIVTEDMLLKKDDGSETLIPSSLFRFLGSDNEPELLENVLGDKAGGFEYFYAEDASGSKRPIGIYLNTLNKDGVKNIFEQYYTGGQRCVAFICPKSVNIGKMFSTNDGEDTAALDTLLYLIGEAE